MLPKVSKGRSPSHHVRPNPVFPQYLRRIIKMLNAAISILNITNIMIVMWMTKHVYYNSVQRVGMFKQVIPTMNIASNVPSFYILQRLQIYEVLMGIYDVQLQSLAGCLRDSRKTKNQWARDDPAFVVICSLLLAVSTIAYCAAYDHSAGHAVFVVILVLLFHFLITGALLATCCWFLTNTYVREEAPNSHVVEQRVEWLYAFDVHCNSFFPMFVMLYVIHYFLSPLLVARGFIPVLLSNLLLMVAASYYLYLNFLGYDVLPFFEKTTFFLYPIGIVIILSPILILSGFNPSRYFINIYFSRWL